MNIRTGYLAMIFASLFVVVSSFGNTLTDQVTPSSAQIPSNTKSSEVSDTDIENPLIDMRDYFPLGNYLYTYQNGTQYILEHGGAHAPNAGLYAYYCIGCPDKEYYRDEPDGIYLIRWHWQPLDAEVTNDYTDYLFLPQTMRLGEEVSSEVTVNSTSWSYFGTPDPSSSSSAGYGSTTYNDEVWTVSVKLAAAEKKSFAGQQVDSITLETTTTAGDASPSMVQRVYLKGIGYAGDGLIAFDEIASCIPSSSHSNSSLIYCTTIGNSSSASSSPSSVVSDNASAGVSSSRAASTGSVMQSTPSASGSGSVPLPGLLLLIVMALIPLPAKSET